MRSWLRGPTTLSARLSLLVAALAIPMLLVIAAAYGDSLRDRRTLEVTTATHAARNGASIVNGFLRDVESNTFSTASMIGTSIRPLDQAGYGPYLASVMRLYPELRAFFITDASGRVVASGNADGVGVDLSGRPYMVALRSGAAKVWSGSILGLQSGEITVAFGRPITAPDGTVRGFVVTAFHPEKVVLALRPDYPADARLVLIDERGHLLYDSGSTEPANAEVDLSGAYGVRRALGGEVVPIDGVATPFAGEARFGALVPIDRTGWALAVTRPIAPLEAELAGRLLGNMMAVLATLAVAAALTTLIANRLARPLRDLSRIASAIARGERPTIPIASGGVEVDQLAAAMRSMQASVAKREDQLELLAASGASLSGTLDHAESLRRAALVAIPGYADCCIVDLVENGRVGRTEVATADPELEEVARALRELAPIVPSDPVVRAPRAIATRGPTLATDVDDAFLRDLARDPAELALLRRLGARSAIALPLVVGDRVTGAVTFIASTSGRRYGADDLRLTEQLARRIALSLENARLYYEVQQSVGTRDDFLSAVAHELKTPLTVISGTVQMLQRRAREAPGGEDPALGRIQASVGRMAGFIEELLELVRRQTGISIELRRAPTDLVDLARRVVADAAPLAHGQDLRVEAAGRVVGEWDRVRLERAIANLVGNAVKYNRADGTVRVRVGTEHGADGPTAYLSVTDEGIGIPASDRARVFERFARGSNVAGRISGTGVGLAIVRQVVEQHGGTVDVVSAEGRGSTFTIRLPLAPIPIPAG